MTTCRYPECGADADVWWKGPWCGRHANAQYGRVPSFVATLASRPMDPAEGQHQRSADGREEAGVGFIPLTRQVPPSEGPSSGRASVVASVAASQPSPLSEAELLDILDRETWAEA